MATLTAKRRKRLRKSQFALPAQRKYPIDTWARAANAKGRALQQKRKGRLTAAQYKTVVRRANAVLKRKRR